jgi:hypothetical protein
MIFPCFMEHADSVITTFFNKFDRFADAPDAVPGMRELETQLAAFRAIAGNLLQGLVAELTAGGTRFARRGRWTIGGWCGI